MTVGHQVSTATGELTSTVNDMINAQSHPGGSGNAVVTTANNDQDRTSASETIESTSKIDNEACPESGIQELVPSGLPSPLTRRSDLDGVRNVDQAREPVERELSEKQEDPRKSYTGVRRCKLTLKIIASNVQCFPQHSTNSFHVLVDSSPFRIGCLEEK